MVSKTGCYHLTANIHLVIQCTSYGIHFCLSVKHYCEQCNTEPKALLLLDNASGHSDNLETPWTCIPVKVVYVTPNTTSLIPPMDQEEISNFKTYYLDCTFKLLIEKTDGEYNFGKVTTLWMPQIISDQPGMKWLHTASIKCGTSHGQKYAVMQRCRGNSHLKHCWTGQRSGTGRC